jgi:hypothetical protein
MKTEDTQREPIKLAYEVPQIVARVDITAGLFPAISGPLP